MPSIPAVLKVLTSLAALAQPQISKFIDAKQESAKLKFENEKLKKEIVFMQKQRIILLILIVLLFTAFIISMIIITKGILWLG